MRRRRLMAKGMEPGLVRITHTCSGETGDDEVVVAEFDADGVMVSWPRALSFGDALALNHEDRQAPDPLILRDNEGWLTLTDAHLVGASASTLAHSVERIRYRKAIQTGANTVGYTDVNGMTSEIDGLAEWAKLVPVTSTLAWDEDSGGVEVSLVARNVEPKGLGGPLGLELLTSYSHNPEPEDGVFTVSTRLLVRTRSSELIGWQTHERSHRMVQDLMCLVYSKPCASRLVSVVRDDDQEGPPDDRRGSWRAAYHPTFCRSLPPNCQLTGEDQPLFFLEEADPQRVERWLSEYELWSRPTWIVMSAIFDRSLPVESKLLQVAVALEALGYAIRQKADPTTKPTTHYESLLQGIFDAIGYAPPAVVGGSGDISAWCRDFNRAYKGVKHADNPLPDSLVAWSRAKEGMTLIRCWLASELGVPNDLVTNRLSDRRAPRM